MAVVYSNGFLFSILEEFIMKLQKNGATFQISIPSALVRAKNWSVGDELEFTLDKNGELVLKKK